MLLEASDIPTDTITADIAVVGGGPAGLTVAAEAAAAGADVVLLEAGGMPYDREDRSNTRKALFDHLSGAQSMTRGSVSGEPYFPLRLSRARGLGGSTNALKGHGLRGRPLDPIDFGPRFGSSWAIPYDEFAAFLPDAEIHAGMKPATDDVSSWAVSSLNIGGVDSAKLVVAPFRHGRREQFAEAGRELRGQDGIRTVIGGTVIAIEADGIGRVAGMEARSLTGAVFTVKARRYVLAGGAIDNARLLLNSRPVLYLMGDASDHVGRYFMEHLHYVPAFFVPESPEVAATFAAVVGDRDRPNHWIVLDDETVSREGLLRVAYLPVPVHEQSLHPAVPAVGDLLRMFPYGPYGVAGRARQLARAAGGMHHVAQALMERARGRQPGAAFALSVMAEQPPDRASRITLSGKKDRLGLPLARLHWGVGRRDFADARRSTELLGGELEALGAGKVMSLWDRGEERPHVITGGWHHIGTTRMSRNALEGVVDGNCRVHGVDNLFVAGSSVFPTSGYANPTLTLVALAVRLGRYLVAGLATRD